MIFAAASFFKRYTMSSSSSRLFRKWSLLLVITLFSMFNAGLLQAQSFAENISSIQAVTIRLKPGEDLKTMLDRFAASNKIKAACIITCVGSLEKACIRYANEPNTDTITGKREIVSLTGTLAESGSHLHISISDSTGKTIGGHLKEGSLVYTTAEIVIAILPDLIYSREVDSTYGYKELSIKKKKGRK